MERLTSEQIRLLEELRELRDSGILTVDEFEFQVAKVLGRPQVVEPIPFVEEPLAPQEPDETVVPENPDEAQQVEQSDVADVAPVPDTSHESELLEYELVEPDISDEDEILVEENQVAEPPAISDTLALPIVETETQQNIPSRRKALIGTTAGLVLIAVIGLVTLVGGGKSDSTSTQIIDNTTTVTQSTTAANTDVPTTSSQIVDNTTTVTQNASIGTTNQPKITTPTTTPVTTNQGTSPPNAVVTALQVSKSHPVLYNYPWDLQQTATFTALIVNDEEAFNRNWGEGGGVLLLIKGPSGWGSSNYTFEREKPGTWTVTMFDLEDGGTALVGLNEFCVAFRDGPWDQCSGPTVSFELLERERNPVMISNVIISPESVSTGDTVTVSFRLVDATGVYEVQVGCGGVYSGASLSSGDLRDGLWTFNCVVPLNVSVFYYYINARGFYSDSTYLTDTFCLIQYPSCVIQVE